MVMVMLDNILGQMLLLKEDHCPIIEFIDYALWVCRSSFTVGDVEKDNITSNSLEQCNLSACSRKDTSSQPRKSQTAREIFHRGT